MSVFYSGWGYWEYDCIVSFDDEIQQKTIDEGLLMEVCCLFELPKKAEKEIKYQGESTVSYLLECIRSDNEGIEFNDYRAEPISEPRFILCKEREGEQRRNIDNRPIIKKMIKFTKDDIKESPAVDVIPKNLTETERNTMLKVIIGMAIDAYGYDPEKKRNPFTGDKNGLSAKLLRV